MNILPEEAIKQTKLFSLSILILIICCSNLLAQNNPKAKYTAEEVYEFFAKYSPQDVVDYSQKAVEYFSKVAKRTVDVSKEEEERIMGEELKKFYMLPLKFQWKDYPMLPWAVVQRCDQGRVVAHPIPEFFAIMSQNDFITKYKDVKGRKIGVILCEETTINGAWVIQHQWWPQTDRPLEIGFFMVKIPNTPYEIQSFYPSKNYSKEELDNFKIRY